MHPRKEKQVMFIRFVAVAMLALSLLATAGSAQTAAELLQKGIYTQDTAGDLDAAIKIYRQVISSAGNQRALAGQAQYRLVVCMLRKNDRGAADKEFQILAQYFADQQDLVSQARALLPGGPALLPAPWGEREASQLNIKRDGAFTGEYLFYTVGPALPLPNKATTVPSSTLSWELKTKNTNRSLWIEADRETMRPLGARRLDSNDDLGDPTAAPFKGPAIDDEVSVFLMRRLPLTVSYTTKLPVTSEQLVPTQMELKVTGIEAVQVPSGKYNCYKVVFGPAGQTFWIGMDRSRPLVKIQAGSVEAELVRTWGAENALESVQASLRAAGWSGGTPWEAPGGTADGWVRTEGISVVRVQTRKIYTPPSEIAQALQRTLAEYQNRDQVRPGSIQTRLIGGQQALSCLVDFDANKTKYIIWIRSESTSVSMESDMDRSAVGVFRWRFEPALEMIRIP
jgi:hypothetical protein